MIFEEETKQEFVLPQLEDAQIDGKVTIKLSSEIVKPTHTQLLQSLAEFLYPLLILVRLLPFDEGHAKGRLVDH